MYAADKHREALETARASTRTIVVSVETDPLTFSPISEAWWDGPVAEISELASMRQAREAYVATMQHQRFHFRCDFGLRLVPGGVPSDQLTLRETFFAQDRKDERR